MAHRSYSQDQVHILSIVDAMRLPDVEEEDKDKNFMQVEEATVNLSIVLSAVKRELLIAEERKTAIENASEGSPRASGAFGATPELSFMSPAVHEAVSLGSSVLSLRKLVRDGGLGRSA